MCFLSTLHLLIFPQQHLFLLPSYPFFMLISLSFPAIPRQFFQFFFISLILLPPALQFIPLMFSSNCHHQCSIIFSPLYMTSIYLSFRSSPPLSFPLSSYSQTYWTSKSPSHRREKELRQKFRGIQVLIFPSRNNVALPFDQQMYCPSYRPRVWKSLKGV